MPERIRDRDRELLERVRSSRRPASQVSLPATRPQLRVLESCLATRFVTVFANRRFGKSTLAKMRHVLKVKDPNPYGLAWWVAPTYRQCRKPFNSLLMSMIPTGLIAGYSRQNMTIKWATGWLSEFRSAERPENLRGDGVSDLTVDEGPLIDDPTYEEALRPTLADNAGTGFFIGSARGRQGWMYKYYRRGIERTAPQTYAGFLFTALDAAFVPRAELEEARTSMSKRAFDQEFMSVFLDGQGVAFENVRSRPRIRPHPGEAVGIGIDWAKKRDWTWFVAVGAESGAVLECVRSPQLPYTRQVELASLFIQRWQHRAPGVYVCHDQTGVGEALDDLLHAHGVHQFEGIVFSLQSKTQLVEEQIVDFEAGQLGFVPHAEADETYDRLIREHEDYTLVVTKTSKIVYGAPEGLHDDAVVATMLANRARRLVAQGAPEAAVPTVWTL